MLLPTPTTVVAVFWDATETVLSEVVETRSATDAEELETLDRTGSGDGLHRTKIVMAGDTDRSRWGRSTAIHLTRKIT